MTLLSFRFAWWETWTEMRGSQLNSCAVVEWKLAWESARNPQFSFGRPICSLLRKNRGEDGRKKKFLLKIALIFQSGGGRTDVGLVRKNISTSRCDHAVFFFHTQLLCGCKFVFSCLIFRVRNLSSLKENNGSIKSYKSPHNLSIRVGFELNCPFICGTTFAYQNSQFSRRSYPR